MQNQFGFKKHCAYLSALWYSYILIGSLVPQVKNQGSSQTRVSQGTLTAADCIRRTQDICDVQPKIALLLLVASPK